MQRAPILFMCGCRPERIDENLTESIPAFLVRARRRSRSADDARYSIFSAVGYDQITGRIHQLLMWCTEQAGKGTPVASAPPILFAIAAQSVRSSCQRSSACADGTVIYCL